MAEAPVGETTAPKSGRRGKKDTTETEGPDAAHAAALKACRATPDDPETWAKAEAQADAMSRPDELAALYRDVLEKPLARPLRAELAQRAVQFHETWFGDDVDAMAGVLGRIVDHDHDATWAFERLTVVLTKAERWDALLDVYDRALAHTSEPKRRKLLLDDAAHVAKDFAADTGRAVDYMLLQLDLDPGNAKLVAAIERLLERQHRYEDLIELWQARLPDLATAEARATRVRIATMFIDHLDAPGQALEELKALVDESPGHEAGCKQLERVLALDSAPHAVRMAALGLLRVSYDAIDKPDAAVAAVERALQFTDGPERLALHREAGLRHAIAGRDTEALAHYAELLRREPSDTDARRQLRQIARRSNQYGALALALVSAADGAEPPQKVALVYEAAQVHAQELGDASEAARLYAEVVAEADADRQLALRAAHQLQELLASAGRDSDRLAVLEQLADLEASGSVRRAVLGEVGRLAARLGEADRALAAYARRLAEDESDHEALAETIDVLQHHKRWAPLVEALERRANATKLPAQRRADLVRMAKIQADELEAIDDAIETWATARTEFGDEPETIDALDRLLAARMRANDRAQIVGGAAGSIRARVCDLLVRVGDIRRTELGDAAAATRAYAEALAIEPKDEGARRGLRALLEGPTPVAEAADALARGLRATNDWQELVGLVDIRVRLSHEPRASIEVLREAAALHEQRAGDPGAALEAIAHAFTLDPTDSGLEHELVRLGQLTGDARTVADAYHTAVAVAAHPARAAHLHMAEGRVRERELGDADGAARAYEAAAEHSPDALEVQQALVRASALAGRWPGAASGALAICRARGILDHEVIDALAAAAESRGAWAELVPALESALGRSGLPSSIARDLELWAAHAHRDRLNDAVAARTAARRALALAEGHLETLELLAELERATHDPQLVDTLVAIDARRSEDVAALREAAELALGGAADAARGRGLVQALHRKAAHLLVQDGAKGSRADERQAAVSWSLDRLIALALGAGEALQAIEALLAAGDLPLPRAEVLDLRVRAAKIAIDMGDRARAIDLLRAVLEERDSDLEVLSLLASLCEREGRVLELVRLRTRELELTNEPEARLALRLELSRLVGVLEQQGGRVDALRRNLAERPGHGPSVAALTEILEDKGRHGTLCEILEEQAALLEKSKDGSRAAELWAMAAKIAEDRLAEPQRAIEALARQVELVVDLDALDALARLHTAKNEPLLAATYLERRLEATEATQRVPVLLKLARAQLQAELETAAIGTLEAAFAEAPKNAEVRKLLLRLYRQREQWEPLARALAIAAESVGDSATVLAHAREAAEIWADRLDAPDRAVPVLERALTLLPDDRELKNRLAEGLRVAGRLDEARALLEEIVAGFGRRRSQERAAVHLQLAKVLDAQGSRTEALDQLELAAGMDAGNPAIAHMLAQTARAIGELDRAERAYRALLLLVRRPAAEQAMPSPVGAAEVLIELASIAQEHGETDQAQELVESALEALAGNDAAAPRLQQLLRERGDYGLLRRVLEVRLTHVDNRRMRAEALGDLADLVGGTFGDDAGSFDLALQAVHADPGSPIHHARALGLAEGLDRVDDYAEVIEHHLDKSRRSSDAHVRCELLLRSGEILERFRNDLDGAGDAYQQAEGTGVREVDVWRAMARLAAAKGEMGEHLRLLERLSELGEQASETRADVLYRMAEVQLADPDTADRGLAALQEALGTDARPERATRILARASDPQLAAPKAELLALFEQVARKASDETALLLALERRAQLSEAVPEDLREAVELATKRGEDARAEALLLRATEMASGLLDGDARTAWALVGLSERRRSAGDAEGAVKWFALAAPVCRPEDLTELGRSLAEAAEPTDPALAVRVYEAMLERDPSQRAAWEPLARLYRRLGDVDRLQRLVEEMLDSLPGPAERNALRLELVQSLLDAGDRTDAAVAMLREALREDPGQADAQALLVRVLEESGQGAEIADLLYERVLAAQASGDADAIVGATLGFVRRVADVDRERALEALRGAIGVAPSNRELLVATIDLLGEDGFDERAALSERLIESEDPPIAARLARELADSYLARGEAEGAQRALVAGYRRAPDDADIRQRLERTYEERGDYRGLAEMLVAAATTGEPAARVAMLRQAATIERDLLGDAESSLGILEQAYGIRPDDAELGLELCSAYASTGRLDRANGILDSLLAITQDDGARLNLLTTRAEMRMQAEDWTTAVADLEAALLLDPEGVQPTLIAALDRARHSAQGTFDIESERKAMLRMCELLGVQERRNEARSLLMEWVERERKDAVALELLQELDLADERWEAVAKASARLVAIEQGEAQVRAALRLSHACQKMERPGDARAGLEHARRKQPNVKEIRVELRRIYELVGAERELAKLLVSEAEEATDPAERIELTRRAADLLLSQGDVETALPLVRAVVEANPTDIHATILLADAHLAAGEVPEAEAVIDAVIAEGRTRKPSEVALLHQRKARAAGARGAPDEQLTELQTAFSHDKNNGWIAAELADMAEAVENWDLAVKVLRTITLIDGECPITRTMAFLRQAKIAHRKGDRQRAVLWARKAKHEEAENPDVMEFLAELGES